MKGNTNDQEITRPDGNWLLATKSSEFIAQTKDPQSLAKLLAANSKALILHEVSEREIRAWENSLPALAEVMSEANLTEQIIILEYCLPSLDTLPDRVDAVLCGADEQGKLNAVFIELKQWANLPMKEDSKPGYLLVKYHDQWEQKPHPRKQAEEYREHMQSILGTYGFPADHLLFSAYAYMHNALDLPPDKIRILFGDQNAFDEDSRLYTRKYSHSLAKRLKEHVGYGQGEQAFVVFKEVLNRVQENGNLLPKRMSTVVYEQRKAYAIEMREKRIINFIRKLVFAFCFIALPIIALVSILWLVVKN